MPNFYQEIEIPIPIDFSAQEKILNLKKNLKYRSYAFLSRKPEEFLSKESLDFFKSIEIIPDTLIAFGHIDNPYYAITKPVIHSDLIHSDGEWLRVPFAINCEITDTTADFCWFDTHDLPEVFPKKEDYIDSDTYRYGNGINYQERNNRDISKMSLLETLHFTKNKIALVRSDIPHGPYYNANGQNNRIHLSLRFPLDKISSWNQALEIFKPFFSSQ